MKILSKSISEHNDNTSLLNAITYQTIEAIRRYKWKRTPYERDLLLTLVITNKCTLRCEHCFEEAGPENKTFLDANRVNDLAEESIDLFKNYKSRVIRITGGDPFLHPSLYQIVGSFSKRRDLLGYETLDAETNGWWAADDQTTKDTVSKLKEAGATLFSMTVDYYHCKQGKFDIYKHFDRINKIARDQGLNFRNITPGLPLIPDDDEEIKREEEKHKECCLSFIPESTPIGRARLLPEKYWGIHLFCRADGCRLSPPIFTKVVGEYTHCDEITIKADGNVYPCNSGRKFEHATLSIGNVYEKALPEIIENQNNPIVQLIRKKRIERINQSSRDVTS